MSIGQAISGPPHPHPVAVQRLLGLLDLVFLLAVVLPAVVWLPGVVRIPLGTHHLTLHWGVKVVAFPLLVLLLCLGVRRYARQAGVVARGLLAVPLVKKSLLGLVSAYVFFGALEAVLALVDFKLDLPPVVIRGRGHDGQPFRADMLTDDALIYKFKPGSAYLGRTINSLGFREREVNPHKAPGTMRVICLGDSITAQGRPGYSTYLHQRLTNQPPTAAKWEAFNMGVYGYSSLQGLKLFELRGRQLHPDIVTIFYGWNDHWLDSRSDRLKMDLVLPSLEARAFNVLKQKRTFLFLMWALDPLLHAGESPSAPRQHWFHSELPPRGSGPPDPCHGLVLRVPPEEYRQTLRSLVKAVRAAGAVPLLITAPRRRIGPGEVIQRHIRSQDEGGRLHDQYDDITRAVARESGADLLDLARLFAGPECDGYFADDGIHYDSYAREGALAADPPDQPGLRRIAAEMDGAIRRIVARASRTPALAAGRAGR